MLRSLCLAAALCLCACSPGVPPGGSGGGSAGGSATGGGSAAGGGAEGGGSATGGGSAAGGGTQAGGGSAAGGGSGTGGGTGSTRPVLTDAQKALLAARPYRFVVPSSFDASKPATLVVLLHGYTASGATQDAYFKLSPLAQTQGFLLATPDGTKDQLNNNFWNATDACCDLGNKGVDDVAYLTAVIDDVRSRYDVDDKKVFLIGHSNGAFMAHRMACDRADRVAGIAAFAGDVWKDPTKCSPSRPVNVLQVHGTLDTVIAYNGGSATAGAPPFPSAPDSVATWATKNGCTGASANQPAQLDLIAPVGAETTQGDYAGCPTGGAVSLWTLTGGSHTPALLDSWAPSLVGWLNGHAR